jgi:hypothetical protein
MRDRLNVRAAKPRAMGANAGLVGGQRLKRHLRRDLWIAFARSMSAPHLPKRLQAVAQGRDIGAEFAPESCIVQGIHAGAS